MGRKDTVNYEVFVDRTLATSFDTFDNPTNIEFMDNVGLTLTWVPTATSGELEVFVSNKKGPVKPTVEADYVKLDFGVPILMGTTDLKHVISMNQLPFAWISFKYTRSAGSGTATLKMQNKQVGG